VFLASGAILKIMYPSLYTDIIVENAELYQMDPLFILSIIRAESNFNASAVSTKNAKGLMQLKPETAYWCAQNMGYTDYTEDKLFEPETNIRLGVWYLSYLQEQFDGDKILATAAYNAGIGNVKKWLKDPKCSANGKSLDKVPFRETDKYIKKVFNNYAIYKMLRRS
jgi:soluble lytic murein transglycosylase